MMANAVIILILIVVLLFALNGTIKHFKGEGACCGGGSGSGRRPRMKKEKKLSGPVIGKKTVQIKGMHCKNCVQSVTEAINEIEGASAKVSLKKGQAVVSFDREIDDDALYIAVEGAGFQVVSIEA